MAIAGGPRQKWSSCRAAWPGEVGCARLEARLRPQGPDHGYHVGMGLILYTLDDGKAWIPVVVLLVACVLGPVALGLALRA
jgi:hypothetical protein